MSNKKNILNWYIPNNLLSNKLKKVLYSIIKTMYKPDIMEYIEKNYAKINPMFDIIFDEISKTDEDIVYKNKSLDFELKDIPFINYNLAIERWLSNNDIVIIVYLQIVREAIYLYMKEFEKEIKSDYNKWLPLLDELLFLLYVIDYELWLKWKFYNNIENKNWNYFKFWTIPIIDQPVMDNEDNYLLWYYSYISNWYYSLDKHNEMVFKLEQIIKEKNNS